jgi:hypothetical protein
MKTRLALAAVEALVVVTIAIVISAPVSRINLSSYGQIEEGMTRQQVEKILGGPPRSETGVTTVGCPPEIWEGSEIIILVTFDATNDRVTSKSLCFQGAGKARGFWNAIRAWWPW